MPRTGKGHWTVTLGPFEPNLYEYFFKVDGLQIADPGNTTPKPEWKIDTSLLLVRGDPLLDTQNVAHGTVREETYYSNSLGKHRRLLVYTPPNYDRFPCSPLPVLYLYHGWRGTRYSWVTEGRLPQILDNLLAQGKAVSMIVVVPEANALDLETIGDGREKPEAYDFTTNERRWMRNFSTMLSLLSRRTIELAMILVNEQLLAYRWGGFRRWTLAWYTLAIFLDRCFQPGPASRS